MPDVRSLFEAILKAMRLLSILVLLVSAPVAADTTDQEAVVEYKRLAGRAAAAGNCEAARDLGTHVQALDPDYYASDFATDPAIVQCLPVASPIREPSLTAGGLVGQIVVGGLGSIVGGFAGALVADRLCEGNGNPDSCLGTLLVGVFIGGSLGVGAGVYFGGSLGDQTGSLAGTMLGAAIGASVPIVLAQVFDGSGGLVVLLAAPVAGAFVGFNATRQWKAGKGLTVGSLIRHDGGQVSLGIPFVMHVEQRGIATTSIPVLSGSF